MQMFKQLHQQEQPLLLANVWDASSAKSAKQAGYRALGTSSAAIASILGYQDGEQMPFSEMAFMVERIAATTSLPLSVDIEAGYSRDHVVIADNIKQLANLGVVAINIEDSVMTETRNLIESERFAELLKKLKAQLVKLGVTIFINVRSDVFLLGIKNPREEAVLRAKQFQQAGADGLFFPCVTDVEDIRTIVEATELPVNVMAMPDLPSMAQLTELGVKRISMGNIAHDRINQQLTSLIAEIRDKQSFHPLFAQ